MIAPGTRLGPYVIAAPIGAGGMGEVYCARDTRLKRDVALKILPELFGADPDRLARFQREAEVLASLNHPNIAAIHGLEESNGIRALVMELVEGPTLADRIAQGAIPVDEALLIARQIAEALEAAHEQGIIHRDLKPANIKIRPDGAVKVLDFGLAKLTDTPGSSASVPLLSNSPTITSPALMTGVGVLLGTAAYMSPEQARGRGVDKRSDIWAFGCVLYEMLTGTRAFAGDDVSDVLASVLAREPEWTLLPPGLSPVLGNFLKRCLHKDRKQRIGDAQTLRLALDGAFETGVSQVAASSRDLSQPVGWRRVASSAAIAIGAAIVTGGVVWFANRPSPPPPVRTEVTTSGATALSINGVDRDLAITPDGSRIVYVGRNKLLVRALDQLEPTVLTDLGNGQPRGVFVSPDSQWVGFFDGNTLKKVAITGGPPVTVTIVPATPRGATWGQDGTIIFATNQPTTGLQRVSASGGDPTVLTTPDLKRGEANHWWPEFLSGSQAVLFTIMSSTGGGLDNAQIAVLDLPTNVQTTLVRGGHHAHHVPTGHLVYGAGGTLRAVAFDLARLSVAGTPVPILQQVLTTPDGAVDAVVAANGTLVFVSGSGVAGARRSLVWVDRKGREQSLPAPVRAYMYPRISPDGARIAVFSADQEQDLWLWDTRRTTLTRLTFEPATDNTPIWTPDGRRLIFASTRAGQFNLYSQAADGTGSVARLTESDYQQNPTSITADGNRLLFYELAPNRGRDLQMLTLARDSPGATPSPVSGDPRSSNSGAVAALLETRFEERGGVVSPDLRWLAYESNSSGSFEIYVRPFPAVSDGQWQVSTGGGVQPLWAANGRELFYVAGNGALMAVPVEPRGGTWNAGTPVKLFEGRYFGGTNTGNVTRHYDVTADGQRFLMVKDAADLTAPQNLVVVQHWFEELKRLVSTK